MPNLLIVVFLELIFPTRLFNVLADAEDPLEEGIAIAAEQVQQAKDICQGVHLMAVKREDLIPQILDRAGESVIIS